MRKLKIANVNKKNKKKNEKKNYYLQIIARLMIQPENLFFFFVYPISLNKYYSLMPHGAHEIY